MRERLLRALWATVAGWAAAAALTAAAFVLPELWRNAPETGRARLLLEGVTLWAGFTLAVCVAMFVVVMVPVAVWAPSGWLLRSRKLLQAASPVAGMLVVGWRLDVWHSLRENPAESPLHSLLLWNYMSFAAVFALVTASVYLRGLRGVAKLPS